MLSRIVSLLLVCVCLVGCGTKLVVKANGKTAEEWAKVVKEGKSDARINALSLLVQICEQDPTQVPFLCEGLKHTDQATRMTAVKMIRNLGAKGALAVPDLQAIVGNESEDKFLKKEAEETLAAIQPAGAAPAAGAPAAGATAPAASPAPAAPAPAAAPAAAPATPAPK